MNDQLAASHSNNRLKRDLTVRKMTGIVAMAAMLNPLNSSMISVALLKIASYYQISIAQTSWLILGYFLMTAIGQPVMGKLADLYGPRRIFSAGLIFVALFSLLSVWAPSFGWLIALRILQSFSNTTLFPAGMAMLQASAAAAGTNDGKIPVSATGMISFTNNITAALGPVIGGFLVYFIDWRSIFWINVPIVMLIMALFRLWIPREQSSAATDRSMAVWRIQLDIPGILLFSSTLFGLMYFLQSMKNGPIWWMLIAAASSFSVLIGYELRSENPFINVRFLKSNLKLLMVYVQYAGTSFVYYCILYGLPLWLQQLRGYSAKETGLILLPLLVSGIVATQVAVPIISRYTYRRSIVIGYMFLVLGTALLLLVKSDTTLTWLLAVLAILGIPNGLANVGWQTALFTLAKPGETGAASGLFLTFRSLGSILATSLIGAVFSGKATTGSLNEVAAVIFAASLIMAATSFSRKLV
ncbi:MFS transporter [Paenibacillus sabinae]|uniref:Major facilitator superfamily protein n=1 Tax=Paenibacillus sabinae T27 TaxID=1268072 RepID=X4ZCW1_9BACL|nr:MFS transporter [Paenibacillus sabinae]AHV97411.1 major facilitator superfamily protein [Paenibacillus sabinae T27]